MEFVGEDALVGVSDIAEMAQVKRSAVSNWPKRYKDFPSPRMLTSSGALYDSAEVERWLIESGKVSGPVPPSVRLWKLADNLRDVWTPAEITDFIVGCAVLVHEVGPAGIVLEEDHVWWEGLREAKHQDLYDLVLAKAVEWEAREPASAGVVTSGLLLNPQPSGELLARILDAMATIDVDGSLSEVVNEAIKRLDLVDRSIAMHETPAGLAEIMLAIAGPVDGVVFDPAVGLGTLVKAAERHGQPQAVIGFDVNEQVVRLALARGIVLGQYWDIQCRDSLHEAASLGVSADLVLLDPPYQMRDWGDANLYVDADTWRFGFPSPQSSDFAWLQIAVNSLKPGGRAIVALPAGATFRGSREESIRRALVEAGCVEAVVFMPAKLRRETSVPIALWVLRRPMLEREDFLETSGFPLIVDATGINPSGSIDGRLGEVLMAIAAHRDADIEMDPDLAIRLEPDEMTEDASLYFWKYQPLPPGPDLGELAREIAVLRGSLASAPARLEAALDAIGQLSEGKS